MKPIDRILVIDDNEEIHRDFRKVLQPDADHTETLSAARMAWLGVAASAPGARYRLDSAMQGQQGLELLKQARREGDPYAMAFVDVRMPPGWDGIETIKYLWAEDPDLQVVLCTAYSDYSWEQIAEQLGQSDRLLILKKPFDIIEARQLACSLTEKWRLASEVRQRLANIEREVATRTHDLAKSEARLRVLLETTGDCVVSMDETGRIIEYNRAAERTFGRKREEVLNRPLVEILVPPASRQAHLDGIARYLSTGQGTMLNRRVELLVLAASGEEIPVEATVTAVHVAGDVPMFTAIMRDIRERKHVEERLRHEALHDALTSLPNRKLFADRLECSIRAAARQRPFAVLFIDLDRFKKVNDSLGHAAGDALLVETARRLVECVRSCDTVARLGGDEFAILASEVDSLDHAVELAERVLRAISRPMNVNGNELFTSGSVGIAVSSPRYVSADEILRDADIAMFQAKARGKACYQIFSPDMHVQAKDALDLENDLRCAIERHEFCNVYQPIVSLQDESIVGFEALVRWRHPKRGLLRPGAFMAVAEETGLMVPIGWQCIRAACQQWRIWHQEFGAQGTWHIAVNISASQITEPDFVNRLLRLLQESEVAPEGLVIEITEDALIENLNMVSSRLKELKSLGIRICIDDFGTGYASLTYLQRLPFDVVKIDQSFIQASADDEVAWQIVKATLNLARNLDMVVVAEGVETKTQCERLRATNCDLGQGYFFAKELDPEEARNMLVEAQPIPQCSGKRRDVPMKAPPPLVAGAAI